jgi:hypothetical protein
MYNEETKTLRYFKDLFQAVISLLLVSLAIFCVFNYISPSFGGPTLSYSQVLSATVLINFIYNVKTV